MSAPIVVGVDDSAHGTTTAKAAASLAAALDRRVVLVHAAADPPTFPYGDHWARAVQRRRATQQANRLLDRVVAALPQADVQTRVVLGEAQAALVSVCKDEDAALLVVGSSERGLLAAALTGSAAAALSAASSRPVMVVPPGSATPVLKDGGKPGSIVCGVDGSPESMHALEVARGWAEQLRLELVPVFADPAGPWPDAPASVVVERGDPSYALSQRVVRHNGQLIVMGSRGRGPVAGALLGSASGALASSAAVPVLIVPPAARIDGLLDASSDRAVDDPTRTEQVLHVAA